MVNPPFSKSQKHEWKYSENSKICYGYDKPFNQSIFLAVMGLFGLYGIVFTAN